MQSLRQLHLREFQYEFIGNSYNSLRLKSYYLYMSDGFRDWIPAGEDTGAIGEGGFQDYVPPAEPKPQAVPTVPPLDAPKPPAQQPNREGGQQ